MGETSASNFAGLAIAKPKPRARQKARSARLQAALDRAVYAHVSERDGWRCRACGTYTGVDAERHHLLGRSVTTIESVCVLCNDCHSALHVRVGGKLMKLSGDAEARNIHGSLNGLVLEVRENDGNWRREEGL